MSAPILAALALAVSETFPPLGAVAGCGGGCGGGPSCNGACTPGSFPPGYIPPAGGRYPTIPIQVVGGDAPRQISQVSPMGTETAFTPPVLPYQDMVRDAMYMTIVAGEATIAGGATTEVVIQPTQGWFDGFYVEIYSVDAANPQTRQRVRVGRFFVGDCPGDCRTIAVFSDVFEANQACCNGRPLRARFSRAADGNDLRVEITNPNAAGSVITQVLVRGYCNRGSCAC